jgi:membrane protease YdiL (CAAX protease family)
VEETLELGPFILRYGTYWLVVWCGGLAVASLAYATRRYTPMQALGIGMMSVPLWTAFWGFLDSIPLIIDRGSDIGTASPARLSRIAYRSILVDLGYLGVGFLLWQRLAGRVLHLRLRTLAERLRAVGVPLGKGEGASLRAGYLLFPALLALAIGASVGLRLLFPGLVSGNEGDYFSRMTPFHAVFLSMAAAVTEELVYRALLMVALVRGLSRLHVPGAWPVAVVLQAILFGVAHAGYGTWMHIVVPFLFGLAAGAVAWRWGLWAAIALHFLIDLYAFGAEITDPAWFVAMLGLLLLLNVAASLGWSGVWFWSRLRGRRSAQGEI